VPVASEVAAEVHAPLDVMMVRKLGVPWREELAMGAIGEDGVRVLNDDIVRMADVSAAQIDGVEAQERVELHRRAERFRGACPRCPVRGRTVVVVDDGLATGATARAACAVARVHGASNVVLAVPVAPHDWVARLGSAADRYLCVHAPHSFGSVGQFYLDFDQTTDDEVIACLRAANARLSGRRSTEHQLPDPHQGAPP
jgi:putative phosphoribosyl transferase